MPRIKEDRELLLPKQMKPSEDELVMISRLVRVVRHKTYWLGAFIEHLLALDAECKLNQGVTRSDVEKSLKDFGGVMSWREWFDNHSEAQIPLLKYFAHHFFPDSEDKLIDNRCNDEAEFNDLVRLWRLEYPEPPKRRTFPKGRTQHEMDPDCD